MAEPRFEIKIAERGSYHSVTLHNYSMEMLVKLFDVLTQDDEIDVTVSPFYPEEEKKEEPAADVDCPNKEPKGEE